MVSEVIELSFGGGGKRAQHCPSLVLQERTESEPKRETGRPRDRKARWTGTREGSGRITSFNVGGGVDFFAECLSEKPLPPLIPSFLLQERAVILLLRNLSLIHFNVPSFCPLSTFSQKLSNSNSLTSHKYVEMDNFKSVTGMLQRA